MKPVRSNQSVSQSESGWRGRGQSGTTCCAQQGTIMRKMLSCKKKQCATCVDINCYYYYFCCYICLILNAKATFFIFHHFSIIFHFRGVWKPTRFPAVTAAYLALCCVLSTRRTPLRALRNILSFRPLKSHLRGHIIISLHDTGIQERTLPQYLFFSNT